MLLSVKTTKTSLSKALSVLHLPSPASSSDVSSGLNSSKENGTLTHMAERGPPPRFLIGVALTLGFTFMFVVDQIGSYLSTRGKLSELSRQLYIAERCLHRFVNHLSVCDV